MWKSLCKYDAQNCSSITFLMRHILWENISICWAENALDRMSFRMRLFFIFWTQSLCSVYIVGGMILCSCAKHWTNWRFSRTLNQNYTTQCYISRLRCPSNHRFNSKQEHAHTMDWQLTQWPWHLTWHCLCSANLNQSTSFSRQYRPILCNISCVSSIHHY